MKRYHFFGLLVLLFGALAFRPAADKPDKKEAINWITIQEAAQLNKKHPRKIVIDVYTDWCGWCKKMDKSTFADEKVAKYVNKNYYAVKLDAETKEVIELNGKTYRFNQSYGVNELAGELLKGKLGYPSTVYLDEDFKVLTPITGYYDTKTFDSLLRYYGENHYKKLSYEEFAAKKN
jgi:thioredoxin-related protein